LVIAAANSGDVSAAKILLDNIPNADSRISLDPCDKLKLENSQDVLAYSKNIIELTVNGAISVSQAESLSRRYFSG